MGKFDGVLLASDFDDTLAVNSGQVVAENVEAIRAFTGQGGRFAVATGRAWRTFGPHAHKVPFNTHVILSNGAALYDPEAGRTVLELPLPLSAAGDLLALSEAFPAVGVECYHGDDLYIHRPNPYTDAHMRKVKVPWTARPLAQMPTPWIKAVVQADHGTLLEAQKWLLERYGDRYEAIFSNDVLLEVTAKGATKGGMVLRLAELLGISREHIYCAGDNQNDIPMLAAAAIGFAPGDCDRTVKDWGARLVRPSGQGSIAHIVEILDGMY